MILCVDASVRNDSRTKRLADAVLSKLNGPVEYVKLKDIAFPVSDESFLKKRDELIASGAFDDDSFILARQFADADTIVIVAPYWDLSFPASLKQYIETINVLGITFEYTADGYPRGLCKADRLYYVMTAGGNYVPEEYGYGYIRDLAQSFYGIKDVELIKAVGLDIFGADPEKIIEDCILGMKQF